MAHRYKQAVHVNPIGFYCMVKAHPSFLPCETFFICRFCSPNQAATLSPETQSRSYSTPLHDSPFNQPCPTPEASIPTQITPKLLFEILANTNVQPKGSSSQLQSLSSRMLLSPYFAHHLVLSGSVQLSLNRPS